MAAVNYYYPLKRGAPFQLDALAVATSSAGTAADVELRIQINDGTNNTNITILDAYKCIEIIESFIKQRGLIGPTTTGVDIPAN